MQETTFQTFDVPGAATAQNRPLIIASGTDVPVRVLAKNIGPITLFVGKAAQDVVTTVGPGSTTFQILAGQSDVFILAPKQKLYVTGAAPGGIVTVSMSEALPLV